jgi:hypothetical protein
VPQAAVRAVEPPQATDVTAELPAARVVELETVTLVGKRPARGPVAPAPVLLTREPICGEFRELLQGGVAQRLRVCE